jgi:plastocyanin
MDMTPRRGVVSIVVVALLLLAVACSSSKKVSTGTTTAGSAPSGGGLTVTAKDLAFSPGTLPVKAGDTVTFTNQDNTTHTFTANDGSFDSGREDPGKTFTFVVPSSATAGTTIAFHCEIHAAMKGSLTVS